MAKVRESGMPARSSWEAFFDPACILDRLGCEGAMDVVEFGCGYGTFTIPAAERVQGTVSAIDIDETLLEQTAARIVHAGLTNVELMHRDFLARGSGLPDSAFGFAMLFNILHLDQPLILLKEAHRVLKPGGRLGVIHWRKDPETPRGPPLAMRPEPTDCREWAEAAGFRFVREEGLACCSWHWGLVLERP